MKKALLILAMTLIAATSYNQTSRRSANSNSTADRSKSTRTATATTSNRNTTTRSASVNSSSSSRSRSSKPTTTTARTTTTRTTTTSPNRRMHHTGDRNSNVTVNRNVTHTSSRKPTYANRTVHVTYPSSRSYRGSHHTTYVYHNTPRSRNYREKHYAYRRPVYIDLIWTRDMHRHYIEMYPQVGTWNYRHGYRINSISAYRADRYIGEVTNVYGKVSEVFYSRETDEYFLYIGPYYPYQDFTVVVPGHIARKYSRRPGNFFDNQYINITGLITSFEGKPEMVVKRDFQLDVY